MTTATRDPQGKFVKAAEAPVPHDLFEGFDAVDSLLARARMVAAEPPVFFREDELDARDREAAETWDGAIKAENRGFDDNYRRALDCRPDWPWYRANRGSLPQPPDAYAGCGDTAERVPVESRPAVTLVASRPLGELEPADQDRLDRFDAAHDELDGAVTIGPGHPVIAGIAERYRAHGMVFPGDEPGPDTAASTPGPDPTGLPPCRTGAPEPRQDDEVLGETRQECGES